MAKPVYTAIVFQGGGALGAYEVGVIKALYQARGGPGKFQPAVVTGLSIGAINAAVLAGAKDPNPVKALERVWVRDFALLAPLPAAVASFVDLIPPVIQRQLGIYGNAGMYRLRNEYLIMPQIAPYFTDSIYDTAPLRATLEREVNPYQLNFGGTQVVVTAVNVESGALVHFGNQESLRRGVALANRETMTLDHVLASASLPPGFPRTRIDGTYYWDGGVISSTPLSEAINCLERIEDGPEGAIRELIVVEVFPREGQLPNNLQAVMLRFANLLFANKLDLDKKLFAKLNGLIDMAGDVERLLAALDRRPELRQALEQALQEDGHPLTVDQLRNDPGLARLRAHKKIDALTRIIFRPRPELANPTDFSSSTIAARIAAGEEDARQQRLAPPGP